MYLYNSVVVTLFNNLGITAKYNISTEDLNAICSYWPNQFGRYGDYQRSARRFILKMRKFYGSINGPKATSAEVNTTIETYFNADLKIFALYNKSDVEKSKSLEYLNKVTGKNLTELLTLLSCMHLQGEIPYFYKNHEIGKILHKLLDYHLIVNFAKEFYYIEAAIRHGVGGLFSRGLYSYISYEIKRSIQDKTEINCETAISQYESGYAVNVPDSQKQSITELTKEMYENTKISYEFMTNDLSNIQMKCAKIPDLDIFIGKFYRGKKTIPKLTISRNITQHYAYFVKFLIENSEMETAEKEKIEFKMPESVVYSKMLVVEV